MSLPDEGFTFRVQIVAILDCGDHVEISEHIESPHGPIGFGLYPGAWTIPAYLKVGNDWYICGDLSRGVGWTKHTPDNPQELEAASHTSARERQNNRRYLRQVIPPALVRITLQRS